MATTNPAAGKSERDTPPNILSVMGIPPEAAIMMRAGAGSIVVLGSTASTRRSRQSERWERVATAVAHSCSTFVRMC